MGLVRKFFLRLLIVVAIIGLIILSPILPPTFDYEKYEVESLPLEGPLALNGALNNSERLFEGDLKGPEHLVVHKGDLYLSAHEGYIYKINQNALIPVVKFGRKCDGFWQEHICGRPLGFEFDSKGMLYVADAYYGIKRYNPESKSIDTIADINTEIEGKKPMLPNAVTVSKNGKVYWTDSSTTHHLKDGLIIFMGPATGRLLMYDPANNKNKVLADNLHFPNGLLLSPDESYLLVAETMRGRILRYYLKGEKSGTWDIFVDKLPGVPDNLHYFEQDKIAVCLISPNTPLTASIPKLPNVRKYLARSMTLGQFAIQTLNNLFPNYWLERALHLMGHFEMLTPIQKLIDEPRSTTVILNKSGEILRSLHAIDGRVTGVSSLVVHNGYYYLGSPFNDYLARVKISR